MAVTVVESELIILPQAGIEPSTKDSGLRRGSAPVQSSGMGFEAWAMAVRVNGDVSGGAIQLTFQFPPAAQDQRYYTVTTLHSSNNDTGVAANALMDFRIDPGDWEMFIGQDTTTSFSYTLRLFDAGARVGPDINYSTKPFYLGRALVGDSGISGHYLTNTDGAIYQFRIAGVRSFRPGMPPADVLARAAAL